MLSETEVLVVMFVRNAITPCVGGENHGSGCDSTHLPEKLRCRATHKVALQVLRSYINSSERPRQQYGYLVGTTVLIALELERTDCL